MLYKKEGEFDRIEKHWKDIMQVALSVHVGKVIPSMLLRRLGVHSKKNKLYKAFRALGQVVRTTFLLKYISDPDMQKHIQASTTKVESFNNFSDWVTFGGKTLRTGDPVEMEKRGKKLAKNALNDACGLTNPKQATHEEICAIFNAAM